MSVPQITTFLTVPDHNAGRAAFVAAANQFGNDTTPHAQETNVVAVFVNDRAVDADASATAAGLAKTAAEAARDAAIDAATAIASDYNDAGHAYAKNDLVWDGPGKLYRCILAYTSTSTRPADEPTHWARVNTTPEDIAAIVAAGIEAARDVPTVTKSGALALTDRGRVVRANAGVTIPAQATVAWPDGATMPIRNITGAAISLTPESGVTLRLDGTTKTGTLSIPAYRTITLHRDAANSWFASGAT
ncbi:MAG: hypothetical protein WBC18_14860 [Ottowia sp.]|uniref:hypothetical protein n=1 Tax=Ottowia sp. TaxID=1898956 RepID=UPI003C778AAB